MSAAELIAELGKSIVELATMRRRTHARKAHARTRAHAGDIRRLLTKEVHTRLYEQTEKALSRNVAGLINIQIKSAIDKLKDIVIEPAGKAVDDTAANIAATIFTPDAWNDELINVSLPPMAKGMVAAAFSQLELMGVDTSKAARATTKEVATETPGFASTASEWLDAEGVELPPNITTELPAWMKSAISEQLRDTFSEPYWAGINQTTANDIEGVLRTGLTEGLSTQEMAKRISSAFPSVYSKTRATAVARTETGDALNSARTASLNALKEELGPQVPMRAAWLSVLGNTTRAAHAALDGVPADGDGLFYLNGVGVPWPSHQSLPAGDRIQCQCTIITEFGMDEDEATELINDASDRIMQ